MKEKLLLKRLSEAKRAYYSAIENYIEYQGKTNPEAAKDIARELKRILSVKNRAVKE